CRKQKRTAGRHEKPQRSLSNRGRPVGFNCRSNERNVCRRFRCWYRRIFYWSPCLSGSAEADGGAHYGKKKKACRPRQGLYAQAEVRFNQSRIDNQRQQGTKVGKSKQPIGRRWLAGFFCRTSSLACGA